MFNKLRKTDNVKPIASSSGDSMIEFIEWIKNFSELQPKNIFEIGANLAQDAQELKNGFGLNDKDVWVFEPHPQLFKQIKRTYKFRSFDIAISDKDTIQEFNMIDLSKNSNSGISSLREHKTVDKTDFIKQNVTVSRMDTFMEKNDIGTIDFLKLDVEGCNYEVLKGFGNKLKNVNAIHTEAEHIERWKGEKLWNDIENLLIKSGFEQVYFKRYVSQSDSFWIRKKFLKKI